MTVQRIGKGGEEHYPPKVHILRAGKPLCAFCWDVPANWPPGHLWVGAREPLDVTCPTCKRMNTQ